MFVATGSCPQHYSFPRPFFLVFIYVLLFTASLPSAVLLLWVFTFCIMQFALWNQPLRTSPPRCMQQEKLSPCSWIFSILYYVSFSPTVAGRHISMTIFRDSCTGSHEGGLLRVRDVKICVQMSVWSCSTCSAVRGGCIWSMFKVGLTAWLCMTHSNYHCVVTMELAFYRLPTFNNSLKASATTNLKLLDESPKKKKQKCIYCSDN